MSNGVAFTRGALLFCASALLIGCTTSPPAERVFLNGHIVTMNDSLPEVEAFAIGAGKIVAVGSNDSIQRTYRNAEQVDLRGRTVMPGIVESHVHLFSLGQSFIELNIEGVKTPDEVVQRVRERVAQTPAGEWITGWDGMREPGPGTTRPTKN